MSRPLSEREMNGLQLMRCPACQVAYIKASLGTQGITYYCIQPSCKKHNHELQRVNPFAIRRS